MQQCGFCAQLSEVLRRALCMGSRRGSTDSYYKELGDRDNLKIEDQASCSEDSIENNHQAIVDIEAQMNPELIGLDDRRACTGPFLTIHKRRKKRLLTRSLFQNAALLDDLQPGPMQCMLDQSAQWKFNAFTLDNVCAGRSLPVLCVHLFQLYGLISHFNLEVARVWKLFSLIEEGYHSTNPYHNHVHAADVTQAMHCFLQQKEIKDHLEPVDIMASIIGAIAHDVDHPGVNQPFLVATSNHLAALYQNTSVLENHHWRSAMSCLAESGLTASLVGVQSQLEKQISSLILATDITRQQEFLCRFKEYLDTNTLNLQREDHRHFVLQIALKCADISNPCRPWEISRKWSLKVCEEFFRQGDYERKLNLPVTALCDRHTTSIPKIQAGFFQFVVTPLVIQWHRFLKNNLSEQMLNNLRYNQSKWEQLLAQEIAEETKTEISDADLVDDPEADSITNVSESSELLLPPRRSSLITAKPSSLKELRRFSVPLNMFQDSTFKKRDKLGEEQSLMCSQGSKSLLESEQSLHSQLSLRGHCQHELISKEKVMSTEKLLPDSSIASITTPGQATRLSSVLGKSGKLFRQQTFPPLECPTRTCAPERGHSEEVNIYRQQIKTDFGQRYMYNGKNIFSNIFKQEKTENDDASDINTENNKLVDISECSYNVEKENRDPTESRCWQAGRRESAPVGSQLRDNITSYQLSCLTADQLTRRRKSMPTDIITIAPTEKKVRDCGLEPLLGRTLSARTSEGWPRRRGSAPVAISELRALVGGAIRHSFNGAGRRKQHKDMTPVTACNQWLLKTNYQTQERQGFQRRSSLPVEVLTGSPH